MLAKTVNFFYEKISRSRVVHRIYIIPTLDGLKLVTLNLILLIMGLIYANNYVLLFNFVLFCLFLGSMFYTHFNINGIKLDSVNFPDLHVNEEGIAHFNFSSQNAHGHSFIRAYFKSNILQITPEQKNFKVSSANQTIIPVSVKGIKRGCENIHSIYLETLFPFNFFRAFTFFTIDQACTIYPERINLNIHSETEILESTPETGEDFFIRNYQIGDSLKRVDWKKLAQTNRWYSRQFQSSLPKPVLLVLKDTSVEETLKSICFTIHQLHHQNIKYGLKLKDDVFISPDNSPRHLKHCLMELARYEA